MELKLEHMHALRVKYCGATNTKGSRWQVSWEGWPSERDHGPRMVRRYLSYDHGSGWGLDNVATRAAAAFVDWLNAGPRDHVGDWRKGHETVATRLIGGDMGDCYCLLVDTEQRPVDS